MALKLKENELFQLPSNNSGHYLREETIFNLPQPDTWMYMGFLK